MNNPVIFDCWASYGPKVNMDSAQRWSLDHLREDMDFFGIASALVRHNQFAHYDPMWVNRRLSEDIASYRDRLHPVWLAMPDIYADFTAPPEFVSMMSDHDVHAVCVLPATHGYPVHGDILRPLADELNCRRYPILTTLAELGADYERAVTFCNIFDQCPVIIAEASWSQWRCIMPIMAACPNVCVEFSNFQANRAVEYCTHQFGKERVLFGSGLTDKSAGAARGFIDWSLLDDESLQAFAGGNLTVMMERGPDAAPPVAVDADTIVADARAGKPVSVPTLDAHCHVLDEGLNGAGAKYVMLQGDCTHMIDLARHIGVDLTAMMSWNGPVGQDYEPGNELVLRCVRQFPEEVVGLSTINPHIADDDEIDRIWQKYHLEGGFRGLKPYWTANVSYSDPAYARWWQYADQYGLYGLLHVSPQAGGYDAVAQLAQTYSNATFIIAHAGGSWAHARACVDLINTYSNIYAELTLTPVVNGIVEFLIAQTSADRIMFGTDAPMRDPRPQLGWCVYTRLDPATKKKLLGENFARILQKGTLPGHSLPAIVQRCL